MAIIPPVVQTGSIASGQLPGAVGATSLSYTKPALVDGDLLILLALSRLNTAGSNDLTTSPAGFTLIQKNLTNDSLAAFYKPIPSAAAESATTYTVAWGASSRVAGILFRVTGVDLANLAGIVVGALAPNSATTGVLMPGLTTPLANALLIAVCGAVDQTAANLGIWTPAAGMTSIVNKRSTDSTADSKVILASAYETRAVAGATADRQATISPTVSANTSGFMFSLPGISDGAAAPAYSTSGLGIRESRRFRITP